MRIIKRSQELQRNFSNDISLEEFKREFGNAYAQLEEAFDNIRYHYNIIRPELSRLVQQGYRSKTDIRDMLDGFNDSVLALASVSKKVFNELDKFVEI